MQAICKLSLFAAATLVCGVSLAQTEIEARADSIVVPSLRVSFDISPPSETPSVPHSGHGIEFGVSGGSGEDTQRLTGSSAVRLGGRSFFAPSDLRHEFDFRLVEVSYRFRKFFGGGRFGIEALGGVGYAELDFSTRSPTQSASEKLGNGGLVGGFGIVLKFLSATSLQSRLFLFAGGDEEGVSSASRLDVHIAQGLGRHAALRAGWVIGGLTSSRASDFDSFSPNSRIRATFDGLSLGLDVMF